MGLPVKQRRILEAIEHSLWRSDPRLTALFAVFTRLNRHEEMPRIEEIRDRVAFFFQPAHRRLVSALTWLRSRHGARTRAALFFPLAFALVAASVAFSPKSSGTSRCGRRPVATRLVRASALSRPCSPVVSPLVFGK
jgi:hypothetical protein